MAKETKKPAEAASAVVLTEDNIREQLDKENVGRTEIAKAALEKIKKDQDERTQREMMVRFQKANYRVDKGLLSLRRERDIAKIQKDELAQRDRLARLLMGFVVTETVIDHAKKTPDDLFEKETIDEKNKTITMVMPDKSKKTFKVGEEVPPVIDYVDYDALNDKIADSTRKKTQKVDEEHSEYLKKLEAKYGEYWSPSWRY